MTENEPAVPNTDDAETAAATSGVTARPETPESPETSVGVAEGTGEGEGSPTEDRPLDPAKVMRIGSMIKQLLAEVRETELDDSGRHRMREIFDVSIDELSGALSSDLEDELRSLAMPFSDDDIPSDSELRVAQAQLVGWLEGLFHGIQATIFAQQVAAQNQLAQVQKQQALPSASGPGPQQGGVYL